MHQGNRERRGEMADKTRHKIKNLLMKLNDEDRNTLCCLLIKAGYAARIGNENHYCPRCNHVLNAGPNYQPKYCDQCGQKLSFSGIRWKEDVQLGYAKRGEAYESV